MTFYQRTVKTIKLRKNCSERKVGLQGAAEPKHCCTKKTYFIMYYVFTCLKSMNRCVRVPDV